MAVLTDRDRGEVLKMVYKLAYKEASGDPAQRQRAAWGAVYLKCKELYLHDSR